MYNRAVKSLVLVPEMQRTDHGNEIAIMAASHCTLRQNADAHRCGTSLGNQSIENFWLHFRRTFTSCLVNILKKRLAKGH